MLGASVVAQPLVSLVVPFDGIVELSVFDRKGPTKSGPNMVPVDKSESAKRLAIDISAISLSSLKESVEFLFGFSMSTYRL